MVASYHDGLLLKHILKTIHMTTKKDLEIISDV